MHWNYRIYLTLSIYLINIISFIIRTKHRAHNWVRVVCFEKILLMYSILEDYVCLQLNNGFCDKGCTNTHTYHMRHVKICYEKYLDQQNNRCDSVIK